jgi:type III secretion protein K
VDAVRLAMRQQLHPQLGMHASWLPPAWPARHRQIARLNEGGREVVGEIVRRHVDGEPLTFDTPLRRIALLDAAALRRLAAYIGLCAHKPLLQSRQTARQMRRQAARLDSDAADFIARRTPDLTELKMNFSGLHERPIGLGRVVVNRGYRLLLGVLASDSEALVRRVQLKLPRRVSSLPPPALSARQVEQLRELMLMCIVPERLTAWDWLF